MKHLTQAEADELRESGKLPEEFVEDDVVVPVIAPPVQPLVVQWDESLGGNLLSDLQKRYTASQWAELNASTDHAIEDLSEDVYGDHSNTTLDLSGIIEQALAIADEQDADSAPPLAPGALSPTLEESVMPVFPQSRFESLFHPEDYEHARQIAPKYLEREGRFDPFDVSIMATMLDQRSFSVLLKRPVHHFDDALAHATALCAFWAKEDLELPKMEDKLRKRREFVDNEAMQKAEQIEAARVAWKTAVAQRDKAFKDWNNYVGDLRIHFQRLRDRR